MMNKEEFEDELLDRLKKKMGEKYHITTKNVLKENGKEMTGITITGQNKQADSVAIVYADGYFQEYLEGCDMDECVENFIKDYSLCNEKTICDMELLTEWENCKDLIYPILIHQDKNERLLRKVVHRKYLDFAVCYIVRIPCTEEANIMTRVDEDKLKVWNIDEEELHQRAMDNLQNGDCQIFRMGEVVKGLIRSEIFGHEDNDMDKETEDVEINFDFIKEDDFGMYVLTNTRRYYGAAGILNTSVLENFAEQVQNDFYIIPSSIHEVILVPNDGSMQAEELRELINDVNQNFVKIEEILSDHAYYYDRELKEVRCV